MNISINSPSACTEQERRIIRELKMSLAKSITAAYVAGLPPDLIATVITEAAVMALPVGVIRAGVIGDVQKGEHAYTFELRVQRVEEDTPCEDIE